MKTKDISITIIAILVVAAVAFGLSRRSRGLPLTPSSPFKGDAADTAGEKKTETKGSDKVVMSVNGSPVTEAEFMTMVQAAPEQSRAFYATPAGRHTVADEIVKLKTLEQEGERMKVADDPEVKTQLEMTREQIIAGRALEKLVEKRAEGLLQKAYTEQKGKSKSLRHIAIAYDGGQIPPRDPSNKPTAQQAMAKAQGIARQLRGGVDFGATAAAVSDDMQSAQKGGLLGPVQPEMLPPDIAAVVRKLQVGQISDPLKTQYAVHIFKVEEPTLDDLRPMLMQQVKQQAAKEEMDRLQKAAKVDLDPKFFPPAPAEISSPTGAQPLKPPQ